MQSSLISIKNLEEIFWRGDTVWNILVHFGSFLVDCRGGFSQSFPFNWPREYLLSVPQAYSPSFMFKCWFPVFNPGHHIFLWIQKHLDLGRPPFMFAAALLSHARGFVSHVWFAGSNSVSAEGPQRPPKAASPHGTWGLTPDPLSLNFHGKILPSVCEQREDSRAQLRWAPC